MIQEIWQSIDGYEGMYEVSDLGRVRSLDRVDRRGRQWVGKVLSPKVEKYGHLHVALSKDSEKTQINIHRLVMNAFVGPRPAGMEVRHLDGNPKNNAVSNLAYGTTSENQLDRYEHGTRKVGEESHLAKYPNSLIEKLLDLQPWVSSRVAAEKLGVSDRYVRRVWSGQIRRRHEVKRDLKR